MKDRQIDDVTIVGGGDAGLIAGLTLERLLDDVDVTIVDDFDEPIPEVGKSTISYILHTMHEVLEIDRSRFAANVKPVWKASVYFEDWCDCDPFHVPFDDFTLQPEHTGHRRFEELAYRHENAAYQTLGTELAERGASPFFDHPSGRFGKYQNVAYHLAVDRLNGFLRDLCGERDVDLQNDRIEHVDVSGGKIRTIHGETAEYRSDLYLDATGFERVLMSALDNGFHEFDFPLDSAVFTKADITVSDIVPATVIRTGQHGWFWQIDTRDWRDLGYVYASEFTSDEAATAEFLDRFDGQIGEDDLRRYDFESGVFDEAWVGNCVAIGNALGFVEPLQSTALTTNAILVEKLADLLSTHYNLNHRGVRDIYNDYTMSLWENIHDFIAIHYRFAPSESPFWDRMGDVGNDRRVGRVVDAYHANGLNSHEEFGATGGSTKRIFNYWQFYRVMRHMGVKSTFYDEWDVDVPSEVVQDVESRREDIASRADKHLLYEEIEQRGIYQ